MTGRGIDQILPFPSPPEIHETYVASALEYVELAKRKNGPIPTVPVDFGYIWGDALEEMERIRPDLRIVNLETSVTKSEDWLPKGINYRMNPENILCITAAHIDCCSLANNHILDWGHSGLTETLETLTKAGIRHAGAGRNRQEAEAPAILEVPNKGRVLVFAFGMENSGVPAEWAATDKEPGVSFLADLSSRTVRCIADRIQQLKQPGDIAVASIHWGGNWGYEISDEETHFAHELIDKAKVDLIHGHSSHHPKAIEVYQKKLILYGCGDFLDDYEGISGYEEFRNDLGLMYFPTLDPATGRLLGLELVPTQLRKLQVSRALEPDSRWLADVINRESKRFGTGYLNLITADVPINASRRFHRHRSSRKPRYY